jgi:hypothetical protein
MSLLEKKPLDCQPHGFRHAVATKYELVINLETAKAAPAPAARRVFRP